MWIVSHTIGDDGLFGRFSKDVFCVSFVVSLATAGCRGYGEYVMSMERLRQGLLDCNGSKDWSEERTGMVWHSCCRDTSHIMLCTGEDRVIANMLFYSGHGHR